MNNINPIHIVAGLMAYEYSVNGVGMNNGGANQGQDDDLERHNDDGKRRNAVEPQYEYSQISQFLLFLSKTDTHVLKYCTREAFLTQASLGAMVLFTGVLALISGYYAINSSFFARDDSLEGVAISALIAAFYAIGIIMFDREVVAVTRPWATVPRLFLAAFIGTVIAFPLELRLFQDQLDSQVIEMIDSRNSAKYAEIKRLEEMIKEERDRYLKGYRDKVQTLTQLVRLAQDEYDRERKRIACRELCQQRLRELKEAQANLDRAQEKLKLETIRIGQLLRSDPLGPVHRLEQLRSDISSEREKTYDILTRAMALSQLVENNSTAAKMATFVWLFFIMLELFPVIIKVFLPVSEYNAYLEARRMLNIHKINIVANYWMKAYEEKPEQVHLHKAEITDLFEEIMEDRQIDILKR